MRVCQPQVLVALLGGGLAYALVSPLLAKDPPTAQPEPTHHTPTKQPPLLEEPWLTPLPVPADPELEQQIQEVQDALTAIHKEMVRRKDALQQTQDPETKITFSQELERLRKEREDLEGLLHELVDEAKLSQQTVMDAALARARWLERQQESQQQHEELLRDRQQ